MSARLGVQSDSAREIVNMLQDPEWNEMISEVFYPKDLGEWKSSTLRDRYGGVFSFRVRGGSNVARSIVQKCKLFENATSLGSTESLIELRAEVEGEGSTVPDDLIRCSVGLECVQELKFDLQRAILDSYSD
jgi:cystathionine gamma-synthase